MIGLVPIGISVNRKLDSVSHVFVGHARDVLGIVSRLLQGSEGIDDLPKQTGLFVTCGNLVLIRLTVFYQARIILVTFYSLLLEIIPLHSFPLKMTLQFVGLEIS
jgi:hypothetical protein